MNSGLTVNAGETPPPHDGASDGKDVGDGDFFDDDDDSDGGDGAGGAPPGGPPSSHRPGLGPWALLFLGVGLGLIAGILLAGVFYIDFRTFFLHPELIGNLESCAKIVALAVGAWWAYSRFLRTREAAKHIEVSQTVEHLVLSSEKLLLRVYVTVENRGKVLVSLDGLKSKVNHVHPLKGAVLADLLSKQVSSQAPRVPWKKLGRFVVNRPGLWLLEPGEKVSESFDFVLSRKLRAVTVYTFVPEQAATAAADGRSRSRYGWKCRSLYRIEEPEARPNLAPPADIYAVVDLSHYLPAAKEEV
ncbi:MAG: hypothetical protein ACJ8GN_28800 [Longimicrobiaceae bacterium]